MSYLADVVAESKSELAAIELADLRTALTESRREVERLKAENYDVTRYDAKCRERIKELADEAESLRRQVEEQAGKLANYEQANDYLKRQAREWQDAKEQAEKERDEAKDDAGSSWWWANKWKDTANAAVDERFKAEAALSQAQERIKALETEASISKEYREFCTHLQIDTVSAAERERGLVKAAEALLKKYIQTVRQGPLMDPEWEALRKACRAVPTPPESEARPSGGKP